jgi:hypothetical protein
MLPKRLVRSFQRIKQVKLPPTLEKLVAKERLLNQMIRSKSTKRELLRL